MKDKNSVVPAENDRSKKRRSMRHERIDAKLKGDPRLQRLLISWATIPPLERAQEVNQLHCDGHSMRAIARVVGVHPSTICHDCQIARLSAPKKRRIAAGESKAKVLKRARRRGEIPTRPMGGKRSATCGEGEQFAQVTFVDSFGTFHPDAAATAELHQRNDRMADGAAQFVMYRPDPALVEARRQEEARRTAEAQLKEVEEKRLIMNTGKDSSGRRPRGWCYPDPQLTPAGATHPPGSLAAQRAEEELRKALDRHQGERAEKIRNAMHWPGPQQ